MLSRTLGLLFLKVSWKLRWKHKKMQQLDSGPEIGRHLSFSENYGYAPLLSFVIHSENVFWEPKKNA